MNKHAFLIDLESHCILRDGSGGMTVDKEVYKLTFESGGVTVRIRIVLDDYSGVDLVITNMTTLPEDECRKGYGSKALQVLIQSAIKNGLKHILAVQVQRPSELFWVKNGFVGLRNQTNDFAYQIVE